MNKHSALRILPASLVLALMMLALAPSPLLAADRVVEVAPDEGCVGDRVRVWGHDYDEGYPDSARRYGYVFVTIYFSADLADVGDRIGVEVEYYEIVDTSDKLDEFGDWETAFEVPDELTDGAYEADVEDGDYFIYVTYWNSDVIVAANIYEVKDVPPDRLPRIVWHGYPSSMWWSLPDCWPEDENWWEDCPYPYPWYMPDDCCDDCDECCDECCDDECWDGDCPYPWPPYNWPDDWNGGSHSLPVPWPPVSHEVIES